MGSETQLRCFAVMTYERCRGNWFAQLLGSTGMLGRPEDWLNGNGYRNWGEFGYPLDRPGQRAVMLARGSSPNGLVGVELTPARLREMSGFDWAEGLGTPLFIHLVRRGRLEFLTKLRRPPR